jgi:tripartite-type tricarboxylate transporter receptor subunit TctC
MIGTMEKQSYSCATSMSSGPRPAKVPTPVLDRLDAEFAAIAREPEFRAQMQARGMEAVGGSGGMLTKWISDETVRWRDVVNKAGIKAE